MNWTVHEQDGIAALTLDHPPLNILTRAALAELRDHLARLAVAPGLRALVILGQGRHFSAGADVGEHLPPTHAELIPEFVATIAALFDFPLPTIAGVRGRCLGGGFELAQACDIVIAGQGAQFGQPEIVLGVTAPAACVLLPARACPGAAAETLFTGDAIPAGRALAAGMVQHVVPDADVDQAAFDLAMRCARHSAAALRATKRTLRQAGGAGTTAAALAAAGALYVDELMKTRDALEGLHAFLEKRTPSWSHQ